MLSEEMYERGVAFMGKIMGEEWIANARKRHAAAVAAGDPDRNDFSTAILFGFFFQRPQLALRDRAIVLLTNDIALNAPAALRSHLQVALYAGLTRVEISEIVFQMTQYVGHPRAREADIVITDFFDEMDKKKPS
jgi:alkylhydroperoxidase/carboxymuconolactone decarboxylase family protein YurZ